MISSFISFLLHRNRTGFSSKLCAELVLSSNLRLKYPFFSLPILEIKLLNNFARSHQKNFAGESCTQF